MRKFLVAVVGASVLSLGTATASAHVVGAHQHVLDTPGTTTTVGPDACGMGVGTGFHNFHTNVHTGGPSAAFRQANNPVVLTGAGC